MKNLLNGALRCNRKTFARQHSLKSIWSVILMGLLFTSCQKESLTSDIEEVQSRSNHTKITEADVVNEYSGLSFQTKWELQQARAATAKYRNIENAKKDGYIDISVRVENMGHHYLNPELVADGIFDVRKPEILVYNKDENGNFHLVAVEYAIPISEPRPEGFTGTQDVWDENTGFELWLLHAWVWTYNPDGVFNPTNPLVHLHL